MSTNAELQDQINTINSKLAVAQVPGFGPVAPSGGGQSPGVPVSPNGSVVPWNAQAGEAGDVVFQNDASFELVVPADWGGGMRQFQVSQIAPQFESVTIDIGGKVYGFNFGSGTDWTPPLEAGKTYTVAISNVSPAGGCGRFQLVGG